MRSLLLPFATAALLAAMPAAADTAASTNQSASALLRARSAIHDGLFRIAAAELTPCLDNSAASSSETRQALLLLCRALFEDMRGADIVRYTDPAQPWIARAGPSHEISFWRAGGMFLEGRDEEACSALKEIEDVFPAGSEYAGRVLRLSARCSARCGRPADSIAAMQRFDNEHPGSPDSLRNLLELASLLRKTGRTDEAIAALRRLAAMPEAADAVTEGRFLLGQILSESGQMAEAETALLPLCNGGPTVTTQLQARACILLAQVRSAAGRPDEALESARSAFALAVAPDVKRRAGLVLGKLLVERGEVEEGVPLVRAFIASGATNEEAQVTHLQLAEELLKQGRYDRAAQEFQNFEEAFPASARTGFSLRGKGWAMYRLGRFSEAAASFAGAADRMKDKQDQLLCRFRTGDALFANASYRQAFAAYESVLADADAGDLAPGAAFQAAECMMREGERAAALAAFTNMVARWPTNTLAADALLRIAEAHRQERRWDDAARAYETAAASVTDTNRLAEAMHGLGIVHYQLFDFASALRNFDAVIARTPTSQAAEQAEYMAGLCNYWLGHDEKALAAWDAFLQKRPDSEWAPDVHFWRSKLRFNNDSFTAAQSNFLAFAESYPTHQMADDALLWAARAAARRREFLRATELLGRLLRDFPGSDKLAEARFTQADTLMELARYPEAILALDEIIQKYPDSELVPATWGRKGDCHFTLGAEDTRRYSESMDSYAAAANHPASPPDLALQAECKIGRCMEKLGRPDDALKQYYTKVVVPFMAQREKGVWQNEAAKVWFTRAAFNAADLLEQRGEWKKASRILERVVEAGVPSAAQARERIEKITAEHAGAFR